MSTATMKPKRKRDMAFRMAVYEWLDSLGLPYSDGAGGERYDYALETPLGTLYITPLEGWVARRFAEPMRAHSYCGHTGKWNFHPELKNKGDIKLALARLKWELDILVKDEV